MLKIIDKYHMYDMNHISKHKLLQQKTECNIV